MPELPDVAVFKRYFDATALHKEIDDVHVRDAQILANVSGPQLVSRLTGSAFKGTSRHGKYLFAMLDEDVLVMHFGMTGRLQYYKDPDREPRYARCICDFDNDYHLAFVNPRKLGQLRLIQDVGAFLRAKQLGPDVLDDDFDFAAFRKRLSGRRGMIKTRLMDQKIMAGIGNVYADEILFQVRIHPKTPTNELDEKVLHAIFDAMKKVLETAIDRDADPHQFPDHFIIPQRREGGECPACGGNVQRLKISGRSSYVCPQCQEAPV
jgi:formamidopyrimidine-DNA glycosylase